jgi:hypothetical protein
MDQQIEPPRLLYPLLELDLLLALLTALGPLGLYREEPSGGKEAENISRTWVSKEDRPAVEPDSARVVSPGKDPMGMEPFKAGAEDRRLAASRVSTYSSANLCPNCGLTPHLRRPRYSWWTRYACMKLVHDELAQRANLLSNV